VWSSGRVRNAPTTPAQQNARTDTAAAHATDLRAWVEALVVEYGLHAQIGPPDRWEKIPPLRAELLALKIADVHRLKLEQGWFELIYWHDALTRSWTAPASGSKTSRTNNASEPPADDDTRRASPTSATPCNAPPPGSDTDDRASCSRRGRGRRRDGLQGPERSRRACGCARSVLTGVSCHVSLATLLALQ
jgi:hypothetical protein